MKIGIDDLKGKEVAQLLERHHKDMAEHSPAESRHALNLEELQQPEITFWGAWKDGELMGCGALMELDSEHAEIKSMRTASTHLRKGVANKLLQHMLDVAQDRGYKKLSLETGSMDAFKPARRLYKSYGFSYCEPFASYMEDPYSVYMNKEIQ